MRLRWTRGCLGGYLGCPWYTQLPRTEGHSVGMDELGSTPPPGRMSPSLWRPTLQLVSHNGTGPTVVLSPRGSPRVFPPREDMGMLFPGGVRRAMGVPKLRRSLLEDTWRTQEKGCSCPGRMLSWGGNPGHPLTSKRGPKSQKQTKKRQPGHPMQRTHASSKFMSPSKRGERRCRLQTKFFY